MSGSLPTPCAEWAVALAARPDDLAPADRDALQAHVASCPACSAVQTAYREMDARILRLPDPQPLPGVPESLLQLWAAEDQQASARRQTTGASHHGRGIDVTGRSQPGSESIGWNHRMRTPPSAPPSQHAPRRSQRAIGAWVGVAAVVVVVGLFATLFALLPHGQNTAGGKHPTATNPGASTSVTPDPIPAAQLRAAYLGKDGHLHLVSMDGKRDTVGPKLPGVTDISATFLPWADASASPDGRFVAYIMGRDPNQGDGVAIVNIATGRIATASLVTTDIYWSPASTRLIADADGTNDTGSVSVVDAFSGKATQVAATRNGTPVAIDRALGWIDGSHVAVLAEISGTAVSDRPAGVVGLSALSGGPAVSLASLDIGSGTVRDITAVSSPPDVFLTPDGSHALIAPSLWNPSAQLADVATGKVSELPHISGAFAGKFVNVDNRDFAQGGNWATAMAWKPGAHTLAISLAAWGPGVEGGPTTAHQQAGVWLLDVDADTARKITTNTYPLAWLPDGRSLLLSDLPSIPGGFSAYGGRSVGPTLSILSPVAPNARPVTLTRSMVAFFGLARAAA
jgi:hypothetical protein